MPRLPEIQIVPENQAWTHQTAGLLRELTQQAITNRHRCLLALSGGSTPKALYETLVRPEWKTSFDWAHTEFLFGDERCVPPDHPDSNYGMARRTLFDPLTLDTRQVHRMRGEEQDAASAAREYEARLRMLTACPSPSIPRLDIVLLGLGNDGHIASLFPDTPALLDHRNLVSVGEAPVGVRSRLTLTLGVINQADVVLFLVTGSGKAEIVKRALEPQSEADRRLPAAMVRPQQGRLLWMLDQPAAAHLTGRS